jgi:hypothetical protein
MDSVDQFFDFVERGEHALINLNPHFALAPIYTRIMPLFVHAVYSGDNFYTHILLPYRQMPFSDDSLDYRTRHRVYKGRTQRIEYKANGYAKWR